MKKKVFLILIILILVIVVAVLSVLLLLDKKGNKEKASSVEETWEEPDYEKIAEEFPNALSFPAMLEEEFLNKYLDCKALYAYDTLYDLDNVEEMSDEELNKKFKEILDSVNEEDKAYTKQKKRYIEGYKSYANHVSTGNPQLPVEIKDIGDLKPGKITGFSEIDVNYLDSNDDEITFTFIFYKENLIMFYTLENVWGKSDGDYDQSDYMLRGKDYYITEVSSKFDYENPSYVDNMNNGQKWAYNAYYQLYLGEGLSGVDIKQLLDDIIEMNEYTVGRDELFLSVSTSLKGLSSEEAENLSKACENAHDNNNEKRVENANKRIEKLKDLIDDDKEYVVTATMKKGIFSEINIKEYHR